MSLPRCNPRRRLTGQRNECPSCLLPFNSNAAFAMHLTGEIVVDRRCRTEDEMRAAGMATNSAGFWVTRLMDGDALATRTGDDPDDGDDDHAAHEQPGEVTA
jgi:hypothetical protein